MEILNRREILIKGGLLFLSGASICFNGVRFFSTESNTKNFRFLSKNYAIAGKKGTIQMVEKDLSISLKYSS